MSDSVEVKIKKWGNSMAVILPKDFLEKEDLRENDKVILQRVKPANLMHLFGSAKGMKMTGQQFKDMVRKGWD